MARYNEILTGRYNKVLTKIFGIKGPAPAPQLAGDIVAGINLFHGVENRIHESWERFGCGFFVPSTSGQTNGVQLRNPSGSNVVIVIERISFSVLLAQEVDISLSLGLVDLTTVVGASALDGRTTRPAGVGVVSQAVNTPGSLNIIARENMLAAVTTNIIFYDNQELVLSPSNSLRIVATVANSFMVASIWWRERFLEEAERVA